MSWFGHENYEKNTIGVLEVIQTPEKWFEELPAFIKFLNANLSHPGEYKLVFEPAAEDSE